MRRVAVMVRNLHSRCRDTESPYLRSSVHRSVVPDDKVPWDVVWPQYEPTKYTSGSLRGRPYADPDDPRQLKFNQVDGSLNRRSHMREYAVDADGFPLNPMGRTGIAGRGTLGRFGPNHAADPIVSRMREGKLQFVAIKRSDNGRWAIPGGMVDAGEDYNVTLRREFTEEALANVSRPELDELWKNGHELYRGYVDDQRNTDNAWMETVVVNYHDENGLLKDDWLKAGDDAVDVRWITVDSRSLPENLRRTSYATHGFFIDLLRSHHEARLPSTSTSP